MAINDEVNEPQGVDLHIPKGLDIQFSHVHLYVDHVEDVNEYKRFEDSMNKFYNEYDSGSKTNAMDVTRGREIWSDIIQDVSPAMERYSSHGRDVVRQLIAGFGFRITGCYPPAGVRSGTKTVLVTSSDPKGIQIVVSSVVGSGGDEVVDEKYLHFNRCE